MMKIREKKFVNRFIFAFLFTFVLFMASGCILVTEKFSTIFPDYFTIEEATLLPIATEEPLDTDFPDPTDTLNPTDTIAPTINPTETNTPEFTPTPLPFILHPGTPAYIGNFAHPSEGCQWLGVAGQVFGEENLPLMNLVILINGKIDGKAVEFVGVTGTMEADIYGPGGYEIIIANELFISQDNFTIQVFNLDGIPLSEIYYFDTLDECNKNLVVINFYAVD